MSIDANRPALPGEPELPNSPLPLAGDGLGKGANLPQEATCGLTPKKRLLIILAAYAAFSLIIPLVRVHLPHHRVPVYELVALILGTAFLPTAVFMFLQISLSRAIVGVRPKPAVAVATLVLGTVLWFPALAFLHPHHGWPLAANIGAALVQTLVLGLLITFACSSFGILLSRIVREVNVLMPAALIAMPIDYIGAMTPIGFTHTVMTKHPNVVKAVSVPVPHMGGLAISPFIGPGDILFLAFFFAIVQRLDLNNRGTFWWLCGLLTSAMLLVIATRFNIAALVPMGLAVLIANWRYFRLKRSEVFAVLYAGLLVMFIVVSFYLYGHSHFFRQ